MLQQVMMRIIESKLQKSCSMSHMERLFEKIDPVYAKMIPAYR